MSDSGTAAGPVTPMPAKGDFVLLERVVESPTRPRVRAAATVAELVPLLDTPPNSAVLVVVGGADKLAQSANAGAILRAIRRALDLAVVPAVVSTSAVVLTGGTDTGIMQAAGLSFADRQSTLIGVAPASQVGVSLPTDDADLRTKVPLEPNHRFHVLTPGAEWGSETDALFELAELLTGDPPRGVVLLIDGGAVSMQEASRFLRTGWSLITLRGTGRAADALALAIRLSWIPLWLRVGARRRALRAWGAVDLNRVEVEDLVVKAKAVGIRGAKKESADVKEAEFFDRLERRILWHLSGQALLKNAWEYYAAYSREADRQKRLTTRFQFISILALLATVAGALAFHHFPKEVILRDTVVAIPVLAAASQAVTSYLLPHRNWSVLRAASEATQRAIYRFRAAGLNDSGIGQDAEAVLVRDLARVRNRVLRSGIRSSLAPPIGRPHELGAAYDEFGSLTVRSYVHSRLDGQLTYYRDRTRSIQRWQLAAVSGGAAIAALATALASEASAAQWVPLVVLGASILAIFQLRARFQERISIYASAMTDLQLIRDGQHVGAEPMKIWDLVELVESVLERENSSWLQGMGYLDDTPNAGFPA